MAHCEHNHEHCIEGQIDGHKAAYSKTVNSIDVFEPTKDAHEVKVVKGKSIKGKQVLFLSLQANVKSFKFSTSKFSKYITVFVVKL